jgi:hypothetical protein
LSETGNQFFLSVAVITMALTPFIISAGPGVADRVCRLPFPDRMKAGCIPQTREKNGKLPEPRVITLSSSGTASRIATLPVRHGRQESNIPL